MQDILILHACSLSIRCSPYIYLSYNEACIGYFGIRDIGLFFKGYWDICVFSLGYGIFRNFGIWDIGIYFGIRVKLILGYGIY